MDADRSLVTGLLVATLALTLVNTGMIAGYALMSADTAGDQGTDLAEFTMPTGEPEVYGEAMGVSFDDVSNDTPEKANKVLAKMASHDKKSLSSSQNDRLVSILYDMGGGISCEYCCEAESVVTGDGDSGCGCGHAAAMRGLVKYLVTEEPSMSDEAIQEEVAKWKTRFFPEQTKGRADALRENDVQPTAVTLSVNDYKDVGAGEGGWVGDC